MGRNIISKIKRYIKLVQTVIKVTVKKTGESLRSYINEHIKKSGYEGLEGVQIIETDKEISSKPKMKKWKKILLITGSTIVSLIVIVLIVYISLRTSGRNSLYGGATSERPNLNRNEADENGEMYGELDINPDDMGDVIVIGENINATDSDGNGSGGSNAGNGNSNGTGRRPDLSFEGAGGDSGYDVIYKGTKYAYNTDMITLLILGIDKRTPVQPAADGISGGQSDALFLVVLNPHTKVMDIVAIPRDSIALIDIYNRDGTYNRSGYAQICLQHGYGDGMELSNQRAMEAVSKMLYDLPVHSVTSINMGAVPELNDAIGGVTVQSLYTFNTPDNSFVEGQTYYLWGNQAYDYVHYRDIYRHNTASERLARQKQYITLFIDKAISAIKKKISVVADVYGIIDDYVVTDLGIDEMTYLASEITGYSFGQIYTLEGRLDTSRTYERWYLDEDALYELLINKFYEKVE